MAHAVTECVTVGSASSFTLIHITNRNKPTLTLLWMPSVDLHGVISFTILIRNVENHSSLSVHVFVILTLCIFFTETKGHLKSVAKNQRRNWNDSEPSSQSQSPGRHHAPSQSPLHYYTSSLHAAPAHLLLFSLSFHLFHWPSVLSFLPQSNLQPLIPMSSFLPPPVWWQPSQWRTPPHLKHSFADLNLMSVTSTMTLSLNLSSYWWVKTAPPLVCSTLQSRLEARHPCGVWFIFSTHNGC